MGTGCQRGMGMMVGFMMVVGSRRGGTGIGGIRGIGTGRVFLGGLREGISKR
jgi:hypothetical protein